MNKIAILGISIIATTLTLGGVAFASQSAVAMTTMSDDHDQVPATTTNDPGGAVVLPPGGPVAIYPRDQTVGGANPFVPYGPNPMVPYGVWTGVTY